MNRGLNQACHRTSYRCPYDPWFHRVFTSVAVMVEVSGSNRSMSMTEMKSIGYHQVCIQTRWKNRPIPTMFRRDFSFFLALAFFPSYLERNESTTVPAWIIPLFNFLLCYRSVDNGLLLLFCFQEELQLDLESHLVHGADRSRTQESRQWTVCQ